MASADTLNSGEDACTQPRSRLISCSRYHWIPVLSSKYRVIRRDLRGHGYSSFPKKLEDGKWEGGYRYNLDTILDEIIDTLDQLGVDKVHFLGESTGGILGEILAAKYV